jgi:hypothetical protein
MLPDDPESTILKRLRRPRGDEAEPPESPDRRTDRGTSFEPAAATGYGRSERAGMRLLIDTKAARP